MGSGVSRWEMLCNTAIFYSNQVVVPEHQECDAGTGDGMSRRSVRGLHRELESATAIVANGSGPVDQIPDRSKGASMLTCTVCGSSTFIHHPVLWDSLITDWQLSPDEVDYVNRQQGTHCTSCGANLRSIVLADPIRMVVGTADTLMEYARTPAAQSIAILEINEAGSLSPTLHCMSGHVLARFPQVDIHAMPFEDQTFDLVVHSDTLEHVVNPIHALTECRRVMKSGGALCFTVPTVVGRLSRTREGLPKSYHGSPETERDDYAVQSEFGADVWTYIIQAGFTSLSINTVQYPSAIAFTAKRDG